MRPPLGSHLIRTAALLACLAAAGCASVPQGSAQAPLYATPTPPQRDADPARQYADSAHQPKPGEIQQLIARLDSLEADNDQLKQQLSDQYMQAIALRRAQQEAARKASPPARATPEPSAATSATAAPAPQQAPADTSDLSRTQLLDALVQRIEQGKDPQQTKALMIAAISVAGQQDQLDPKLLDRLDPRTREKVARFHQMLATCFDQLAGDQDRPLTRREMIEKIDAVFGAQPLEIAALELCRRVDSYGAYEPFAATRFLAGRQNRVLVYVELENFRHEPIDGDRYEVRLEQSVELYDATGEATVWRQGPVELVDVSRNKRRDFFIVYPIDLPARLGSGIYRLKVRVADKHTGSICEQTLHDIRIVADEAMVDGR